ncbi:MAG: insulinase family protein [Deltaproteobacteria bacterium]|nr:insulinase family protein [Deltaproteobacteria bacterium]
MRRRLVLALALAMGTTACAAIDRIFHPRAGGAATDDVEIDELAGGAKLVVRQSRGAPVVAILLAVGVGSADEASGESGIAQLLDGLVPARIEAQVEAVGGRLEAWTTHDQTIFEVVVPKRAADRALELLAGAVLEPSLTADRIDQEVGVRVARIRRSRGDPERLVVERLFGEAFRAHPYGRPVVGRMETVAKIGRGAIARFHRRWYVPANMTLVVTGDFDPAAIREKADRALGSTRSAPARPDRPAEPPQRAARVAVLSDRVDDARLAVGFRVPAATDPALPALDVLAAILTGPNGRLSTEIQARRGLATHVGGTLHAPRDPGLLVLTARCAAADVANVLEAIAREAFRLRHAPPAPSEVARARRMIERDDAWPRDTATGLARKLGWLAAIGSDRSFGARYRASVRSVGPRSILDAARRFLDPRSLTVVALVPEGSGGGLDRRLANAVTSAIRLEDERHRPGRRETLAGGVLRETLPNGLRAIVRTERSAPVVAVRIALVGGAGAENSATAGLSALLAGLIGRASSEQEQSIRAFSGRDSFGIDAGFLASSLDESLARSVDALLHPALDARSLEDGRQRARAEIDEATSDPRSAALLATALFGSHPYGRNLFGRPEVVDGADRTRLRSFASALLDPRRMVVAIAGDVDPERALALMRDLVGGLRPAPEPVVPVAEPPPPPSSRAVTAARHGREAEVAIGFLGVRWTDRDRTALEALASILERRLRGLLSDRGLAFRTSVSTFAGIDPGLVAIAATVAPENVDAATAAILAELGTLRAAGPSSDELRWAQTRLHASHASSLEGAPRAAARLAMAELLEGGAEEVWRTPARIDALTTGELRRVAQTRLADGHQVVAVVRPDPVAGP